MTELTFPSALAVLCVYSWLEIVSMLTSSTKMVDMVNISVLAWGWPRSASNMVWALFSSYRRLNRQWNVSAVPGHMVDESLRSVLRKEVRPKLLITADTRPSLFCWSAWKTKKQGNAWSSAVTGHCHLQYIACSYYIYYLILAWPLW